MRLSVRRFQFRQWQYAQFRCFFWEAHVQHHTTPCLQRCFSNLSPRQSSKRQVRCFLFHLTSRSIFVRSKDTSQVSWQLPRSNIGSASVSSMLSDCETVWSVFACRNQVATHSLACLSHLALLASTPCTLCLWCVVSVLVSCRADTSRCSCNGFHELGLLFF